MDQPQLVILAGPNGAGKTTASDRILRGAIPIEHFVNADTIARGLSAHHPEAVAFEAGRLMLDRLQELLSARANFAFETTLASRTFANYARKAQAAGYFVSLNYFWLPSPEISINRVRDRVRRGGHFVPDDDVRRRYRRGIENFFVLYRPIVDAWAFFDNSASTSPRLIAKGGSGNLSIDHPVLWQEIELQYGGSER